MTAIFAVRHPQTTWNVAQRYQGRLEAPLSPEGREQCTLIARTFANHQVTAVFSSPLQRAFHLAKEVARATHAPLHIDQRLTEIGLGVWEGLYRDEIEHRFPDLYHRWYLEPETVDFPGGESLHEIRSRTQAALAEIFSRYADGNVAVVTHSVVIQTLSACALRLDLRNIHSLRVSNGGITTICGSEAPGTLLSLNVTDHIFGGPIAAASAQDCVTWKERRMTA